MSLKSVGAASSLVLLLGCLMVVVQGFVQRPSSITTTPSWLPSSSKLFGIQEWRDDFYPAGGITATTVHNDITPTKPICLLPFAYTDVLLQGETKQLRLYEDHFIKLFDTVMDKHHGVLAMALFADEEGGVISSVPVCEVEAYNRMIPGLGIFATVRVVGRATLTNIRQQDPFLIGDCQELVDTSIATKEHLADANLMADVIEATIQDLTSFEQRFETADPQDLHNVIEDSGDSKIDEEMTKRLQQARLGEDYFDDDDGDWDKEDEENSDDWDDDDDDFDSVGGGVGSDDNIDYTSTRLSRFETAKEAALLSDTQGYTCRVDLQNSHKSLQELTAISWAGMESELAPEVDATYRLQALDETSLLSRLTLASKLLIEKRKILENTWEKLEIRKRNRGGDSSSSESSGDLAL